MSKEIKLESECQETTKDKRTQMIRESFHMIFYLILVFLSSYMIIHFIGQRTLVLGHSMENTLWDQDNLIVDKVSYHFNNPKRYDIIVFPVAGTDDYYIKRIIGLPQETIQIINGEIFIDDLLLEENYGNETIAIDNAGIAASPILLGENEYFVLGDNRNHSTDSRDKTVGNVNKTTIVGRAWVRVWPFKRFGILRHQ